MKKIYSTHRNIIPLITNGEKLAQLLEVDSRSLLPPLYDMELHAFALKVPRSFASRMRKKEPSDPLLLQILPQTCEEEDATNSARKDDEYTTDPLHEKDYRPLPGLLHKYHGRVLLLLTRNCLINCRFCFRRHTRHQVENWPEVLAYLANDATINEVILSGGDPLLWEDNKLNWLFDELSAIPHIKVIRFHTRMPIVAPERITNEFLAILAKQNLPIIFVIHCNHSQEINFEVAQKLKQLRANSYALLNQSVLLKGINDDVEILKQLSEKLFAAKTLPYYLHMLDKVKGTQHFYVSEDKAKALIKELQQILPGYLVPKLVKEEAGEKAKVLL